MYKEIAQDIVENGLGDDCKVCEGQCGCCPLQCLSETKDSKMVECNRVFGFATMGEPRQMKITKYVLENCEDWSLEGVREVIASQLTEEEKELYVGTDSKNS